MTSALDRLLDVFVYAPLGLALKAAEELPKLAAQGRERIGGQSDLARMVGQMAVAQGRRKVEGLFDRGASGSGGSAAPAEPAAPAAKTAEADFVVPRKGSPVAVRDLRGDEPASVPVPAPETVPDVGAPVDITLAPAAEALPIPGYDSLSASQVVQRLAGLSADELEAVRAYEQAGRGRKTVLLRIAQLRAAS